MAPTYSLHPIGYVHRKDGSTWIDILPVLADGLLGLAGYSHIHVLYWFHENDTPEKRRILRVHPRRNPENPLTGVFATHAPLRPNPIAVTLCRLLSIEVTRIFIDRIDAHDASPVIDIKPYIPPKDPPSDVRLPGWV